MSYNSLLINTSDILRRTFDKWGEVTATTTLADQPCRIMYDTRLMRDFKGEEVISAAKLFYKYDQTIDHQDLVKFDDLEHAIIIIKKPQDASQIHHLEVWVK